MARVQDKGYIGGLPWLAIECKDRSPYDIPGALRQAREEAKRKNIAQYAVILKMRGKSVEESVLIVHLAQGAEWLRTLDLEQLSRLK